ncbi:UrcA family protein [Rhizomicrobium palustre]|uniref:UrcA family protein n=1 Tax=Rhizomicrobium palustre TaxID=189966 RepID=A0A846N0I9_9PROT|nr:UrcA family protein [Rhizomicrobium palustre]NIK89464.1 UrcA family protein [Rhizomicrobium palustre]
MFRSAFAVAITALTLTGIAAAEPAVVYLQAVSPVGNKNARATKLAYDDSELASTEGATALYRRIEAASHLVCGDQDATIRDIQPEKKLAACRSRAIGYAVASVNAPKLAEAAAAAMP